MTHPSHLGTGADGADSPDEVQAKGAQAAKSVRIVTLEELKANDVVGWYTVGNNVYQVMDIMENSSRYVGRLESSGTSDKPESQANTNPNGELAK